MVRSVDTQAHIGCKHEGTDVQGCAVGVGHPVTVHIHDGLDGLDVILFRNLGDAQTVRRILHPLGVAVGTEQLNGAVGGAVCLHALENLLGIVENGGGRIQLKGAIGYDPGVVPALTGSVVHHEHVIGENFAEAKLGLVLRFCLGGGSTGDFNIQHDIPSFLTLARKMPGPPPRRFRQCYSYYNDK